MSTNKLSGKAACIDAYFDAGIVLFPCKYYNRTPAQIGWQSTVETPDELGRTFGVIIQRDMFVLDFDPRRGENQLEEFLKLLPPLPETFTVNTPRGGVHIYFRKPPGTGKLASSVPGFKAIEIKQRKQYVIAAGAEVKAGHYTVEWGTPSDIAVAPNDLINMCSHATDSQALTAPLDIEIDESSAQTRFIMYLQTVDPAESAYVIACQGKDFGLSPAVTARLMSDYINPRWTEPADYETLLAKANNAWSHGQNAPGAKNYSHDFDEVKKSLKKEKKTKPDPNTEIRWDFDVVKGMQVIKPEMVNVINFFRLEQIRGRDGIAIDNPLKGLVRYNRFSRKREFQRMAPWHIEKKLDWHDSDTVMLKAWLKQEQHTSFTVTSLEEGVTVVSHQNSYHPLLDWLESLRWDGKPRLDSLLPHYAGAFDKPYTRAVGAITLIGAVARIYEPGCQHDTMLVLEGKQGSLKTTFVRVLGGEYSAEIALDPNNTKDILHKMLGKWIIEIPEMEFTRHADMKAIKAFLSITADTDRLSYERHASTIPRQSIFIGTINPEETGYLRDTTGNRRFLPVATSRIRIDELTKDRSQLFAEAVFRYKQGEPHFIKDPEIVKESQREQEKRMFVDMWEDAIAIGLSESEERFFTNSFIAENILFIPKNRHDQKTLLRISATMIKLGYKKVEYYSRKHRSKMPHWTMPGGLAEIW